MWLTSGAGGCSDGLQFAVVVSNKRHVTKRHTIIADMTNVTEVILRSTNHVGLKPSTRTQWQPCRLCYTPAYKHSTDVSIHSMDLWIPTRPRNFILIWLIVVKCVQKSANLLSVILVTCDWFVTCIKETQICWQDGILLENNAAYIKKMCYFIIMLKKTKTEKLTI